MFTRDYRSGSHAFLITLYLIPYPFPFFIYCFYFSYFSKSYSHSVSSFVSKIDPHTNSLHTFNNDVLERYVNKRQKNSHVNYLK